MRAWLTAKAGALAGQRFPVETQLLLGRVDGDLILEDPLVSRRHAVVRVAGTALEIEDLGSLNGTWVNGERIEAARPLRDGDVVQVGEAVLEVGSEPVEPAGTVLAPIAPHAATPTPPGPAPPGDELRVVTALFADVVGSTTIGERLGPDEVKLVIGEFVNRMSREIERFGGIVQAYMGDGIAAFFGAPRAHEDDPERAARAALAIVAEARRYAGEIEGAWGIAGFDVRVGINTGETAVGLVGAAAPQSVSVGDTTNVAARLESAAEPGSVVVGEATARSLVRTFALEPLGGLTVKGRHEPVVAWRLVGPQASPQPEVDLPLVGRDAELARLRTVFDELVAGRGQIALVRGESGLGKTRLVAEERRLDAGRTTWLEGHGSSYGTEVLYGPFIQILRNWLGVQEGQPELSVRTRLRAKLGLLPSSQLADVLPYLARLLSLQPDPAEEERLRAISPGELAAEIRRAYRTWIACLAQQGPVVVVVEDLHWADHASCELIDELLELADRAPLLLLLTLRPEPASEGWRLRVRALSEYQHRTTELPLAPLDDEAAKLLLRTLPRSGEVGEAELELVVAGAEGNPLYLQELLAAFADGAATPAGATWAPTVTRPKVLTPTLESLLLARIDALPEGCRRLAQLAAVIGRSFPLRVLEHLSESASVEHELTALVRADVVRELRRYPEPEYTFRHGLLRQACLSTLPPARRRALHGAVAAAFEALHARSLDEHLEVIAHHYARSDDLGRALQYLERAAEHAAALDAGRHAEELWRRALKVAEKLGDAGAEEHVRARLAAHAVGGA